MGGDSGEFGSGTLRKGGKLSAAAKTGGVLVWLLLAAVVLSFLGSYAVADVLVKADIIPKWPAGHDPRPRWMATGFVILTGVFCVVGSLARWASERQLRRIDAMADAE